MQTAEFYPEIVRNRMRRVLIYRLGSLGDTVVALPALHLVARAFPNAERRMLTNFPVSRKAPAAAAILADNGLIHGYFRYVVGTRSPWALFKLWVTLLWWRPRVLVYLGPVRGVSAAKRDAWFFRLCGISWQVGVPVTEAMQLHAFQPKHQALEPECERLARNLAQLGDAKIDTQAAWDMRLSPGELAKAEEVLLPAQGRLILAVSVGTKVQSKDWGAENWRALLMRLSGKLEGYALVLTGVSEEREASDAVGEGWSMAQTGAMVLNLCGVLTPRESAAVYAQARLFLGHDSGPMHLAAAVGTRCVAIFAARNIPRVWFPHGDGHRVLYHAVDCMGCGLETCIVEEKRCLTSIGVEEVAVAVEEALGLRAATCRPARSPEDLRRDHAF